MKKLYAVDVRKTYQVAVYCEYKDADNVALGAVQDDPGSCNEDVTVLGACEIRSINDVPSGWANALPYGGGVDDRTVLEILLTASSEPTR